MCLTKLTCNVLLFIQVFGICLSSVMCVESLMWKGTLAIHTHGLHLESLFDES